MSRPQGSRNRLVSLDYDSIAELAGGITTRWKASCGQQVERHGNA